MIEKSLFIFGIMLLYFFKTLGFQYVSDDIPSHQREKPKNKWKHFLLSLEGHLKVNPRVDHAVTTVLHGLVCVFIYLAFRQFDYPQAENIAFLAAFLFAVNPINNQGSVWISGRGYVLSALGMTMALSIPLLSMIFLTLATYSNAGFLAPLCLIGTKFWWMLLFMPIIWAFHWKRFKGNVAAKIKMEMYAEDRKFKFSKIILFIKTASFYFVHSLIPVKTTFYHSYMQSMAGSMKSRCYSLKDRFFWIGLAIFAGIGWYWLTHKWDMVSFGLLWWIITIAPFCNFMRLQQEIAERYAYLPNVGLMIVLASIIIHYPIMVAIFLTMFATKLWFYMDAYQDDYFIVEHSCMHSPDSWFCWHVRAMKRWEQQSYQEAVILWTMARLISPKEFKILFNISTALKMSGHKKEADDFFNLALQNIPEGQEEITNKIIEDWKKGQWSILL